MQLFTNEIMQRKYRKIRNVLYVGMTMVVLCILVAVGLYLNFLNNSGQPINEYMLSEKLETGKKAYIDVISEPIYVGSYQGEDKAYFIVKDVDYSYVVYLDQSSYLKYKDASEEHPIRMTGVSKEILENVMIAIINVFNEDASKEEMVTKEWFVNYLGLLYLDEGEEPSFFSGLMIGDIVIFVFGIFILVTGFVLRFLYEKNISIMSLEEIEKVDQEINHQDSVYYSWAQLSITKHYVVSFTPVFEAIAFQDILWVYPYEIYHNGEKASSAIAVITKDFQRHNLAKDASDAFKKEFDEIYHKLSLANAHVMVDYNKQNEKKYQELLKKNTR